MMLKAAMLILAVLLALGMIGKWWAPRVERKDRKPVEAARKCQVCEVYVMGSPPPACSRSDCPNA